MEILERLRWMKAMCDELSSRLQLATTPDPNDLKHFATLSQFLTDAQLATAEYAAMARAFLR